MTNSDTSTLVKLTPSIFVLLWGTGFVGAKYGMDDAEPFIFLSIRFALTTACLLLILALWVRPKVDDWSQVVHSFVIGCLIHGGYLGGVFYAVHNGLAAGISSLVVALQPFLTALIAFFVLKERLSLVQMVCFVTALFGVYMVLFPDLDISRNLPGVTAVTVTACLVGTLGISIGSVYQKRTVTSLNLWVSTTAQFAGAAIFTGILSMLFEAGEFRWTTQLVLTMAWLVLVLSIGAVGLLMFMIRRGDTASVASLFYLVPVVALFMTWVLFDEQLVFAQIVGSVIVVASVAYASSRKIKTPG